MTRRGRPWRPHEVQMNVRVRGEVLADRPPSIADLPRLRYTEAVVHESLRLFPPAYAIGREAIEAWRAPEAREFSARRRPVRRRPVAEFAVIVRPPAVRHARVGDATGEIAAGADLQEEVPSQDGRRCRARADRAIANRTLSPTVRAIVRG